MNEEEVELVKTSIQSKTHMSKIVMWVSLISVAINIIGGTTFWIALPEKFRSLTADSESLKLRMAAVEARSYTADTTLARVDERTKAMQEDIAQIKSFTFHISAKPLVQ